MPKSRKRGGEKAHRKRVQLREQKIKKKIKEANEELWKRYEQSKNTQDSNNKSVPGFNINQ